MSDADLNQWIDIFDKALTSRDPLVKEQLSKLLMIAALATSNDSASVKGPFREMIENMENMSRAMSRMQARIDQIQDSITRNSMVDDYSEKYARQIAMQKSEALKKMHVPLFDRKSSLWQDIMSYTPNEIKNLKDK